MDVAAWLGLPPARPGESQVSLGDVMGVIRSHAFLGDAETISELIEMYQVDLDAPNGNGETALYIASERGNVEVVSLLLRFPVDINRSNGSCWTTALHAAALCGRVEVVKILIKNGADVDAIDLTGDRPLGYAVQYGELNTVALLLVAGANPDYRNHHHISPLQRAIQNNDRELVQLLIHHGASPLALLTCTISNVSTIHELVQPRWRESSKPPPIPSLVYLAAAACGARLLKQ